MMRSQYEEGDVVVAVEPCTYSASDEANVVTHMLHCKRRHTAAQRSLFNALLHRMNFWMQNPSLCPSFITGPRMCVTLRRGDKCVVLFGEEHVAELGPADKECIGYRAGNTAAVFPVFLKEWLLRTSVQTDVYLEMYYKTDRPEDFGGVVGLITRTFQTCFTAPKTGCYYENVRFHGTDLDRGNLCLNDGGSWEFYAFLTPMVKKAARAVLQPGSSFELNKQTVKQLKTQWLKRMNRFLFGRNVQKFIRTSEPVQNVEYVLEKVRKNWFAFKAAAPEAVYKTVEKALLSRWLRRLVDLLDLYLEELHQMRRDPGRDDSHKMKLLNYSEDTYYAVLMDMYTLGRMLKSPVLGPSTIVFYGGEYHAEVYESVFVKLGYAVVQKHPTSRGNNCVPTSALTRAFKFMGAGFDVRAAFPGRPFAFYRSLKSAEEELNAWLMAKELKFVESAPQ